MSLTPRGDGAAAGAARSALAPYTPPASAEEMERMQLMRQAVQWIASDASGFSPSATVRGVVCRRRIPGGCLGLKFLKRNKEGFSL